MKKENKKGFTLVELLVVVLIIGILAAVAVPQYQLAVNKARFASLRSTAEPLIKAAQAYHLENGTWPSKFDELAVELPGGFTIKTVGTNSTCGYNQEMYCCLVAENAFNPAVTCGKKDETFAFHYMHSNDKAYCVANLSSEQAVKLCTSLGTATYAWEAFTYQGAKTGYRYYTLN